MCLLPSSDKGYFDLERTLAWLVRRFSVFSKLKTLYSATVVVTCTIVWGFRICSSLPVTVRLSPKVTSDEHEVFTHSYSYLFAVLPLCIAGMA